MDVDFDELRKGFDSLEQSDLVQSINNVNKANSVSTSGYSFNVGIYSFNINNYYGQIANIKRKLNKLNNDECLLMRRASEIFNRLLMENTNSDYTPELDNDFINNTSGSPMPLTKDRIILLTYNLSKGTFGQTPEEQIEYFKNNFGYGVDVYNLILTNLNLQNKDVDKINSAYDVSINVDVPELSGNNSNQSFKMSDGRSLEEYLSSVLIPIGVKGTQIWDNYLSKSNYFSLVKNIKSADSYKNYVPDSSEILQKKLDAVKSVYGYSDDQMKTMFSIVGIECVSYKKKMPDNSYVDRPEQDIYRESANVISTVLNRANRDGNYDTWSKDPYKIINIPRQYSALVSDRFWPERETTPDVVKQAVCDVLLSGVPSHDYDSYRSAAFIREHPMKADIIVGDEGNGYFNLSS